MHVPGQSDILFGTVASHLSAVQMVPYKRQSKSTPVSLLELRGDAGEQAAGTGPELREAESHSLPGGTISSMLNFNHTWQHLCAPGRGHHRESQAPSQSQSKIRNNFSKHPSSLQAESLEQSSSSASGQKHTRVSITKL